jgi:predicted PurR-regulated permease PerM
MPRPPATRTGSSTRFWSASSIGSSARNGTDLIHPAVTYGRTALEVLVAIFFTFTIAAYWIFDKERAQEALAGLAKPGKRKSIVQTWDLIEAKLGGYVRGSLLMVAFVSTVLSLAFWLIGVPFWLLINVFAGLSTRAGDRPARRRLVPSAQG